MKSSSKNRYWLGFDLGGTKMMATVFDKDFNIVAYRRKKTKDGKGSKGVLARIVETVEEALQAARLDHKRLGAIGIGIPGWLDLDRGVVLLAPNLGLRNVPLKKGTDRRTSGARCHRQRRGRGHLWRIPVSARARARAASSVCFPGPALAAAWSMRGNFFGTDWVMSGDWPYPHAAQGSIVRLRPPRLPGNRCQPPRHRRRSRRGGVSRRSAAFVGTRRHRRRGNSQRGTGIAAIKAGDHAIEEIVIHSARDLGIAIGSVVNFFAPDMVVLGGGMVEAMPALYVQQVRASIKEQALRPYTKSLKVVVAKLGDDAVVMGAAALAAEYVRTHGRDSNHGPMRQPRHRFRDDAARYPGARPVAVIDIGASAIRLRIAVGPNGEVRNLDSLRPALRLGKDTFSTGRIQASTIEDCIKVLLGFRHVMTEYGVTRDDQIRAVATSAVREAENRYAFVDRVYMSTQINVNRGHRRESPDVYRGAGCGSRTSC